MRLEMGGVDGLEGRGAAVERHRFVRLTWSSLSGNLVVPFVSRWTCGLLLCQWNRVPW